MPKSVKTHITSDLTISAGSGDVVALCGKENVPCLYKPALTFLPKFKKKGGDVCQLCEGYYKRDVHLGL